ncbi:MAG TPA: hypothetical protein VHB73_02995 [Alphaproteobacteria bacterium]|nr:hypothetical protein [Alphaproteobacteria bacterium]
MPYFEENELPDPGEHFDISEVSPRQFKRAQAGAAGAAGALVQPPVAGSSNTSAPAPSKLVQDLTTYFGCTSVEFSICVVECTGSNQYHDRLIWSGIPLLRSPERNALQSIFLKAASLLLAYPLEEKQSMVLTGEPVAQTRAFTPALRLKVDVLNLKTFGIPVRLHAIPLLPSDIDQFIKPPSLLQAVAAGLFLMPLSARPAGSSPLSVIKPGSSVVSAPASAPSPTKPPVRDFVWNPDEMGFV